MQYQIDFIGYDSLARTYSPGKQIAIFLYAEGSLYLISQGKGGRLTAHQSRKSPDQRHIASQCIIYTYFIRGGVVKKPAGLAEGSF
jgi:hypothetical protein